MKLEEKEPMHKVICLILNEASSQGATAVRFWKKKQEIESETVEDGMVMQTMTSQFGVEYMIDDNWQEIDSPPNRLWQPVHNIILLAAGIERMKEEPDGGFISDELLVSSWKINVVSLDNELLFEKVSKVKDESNKALS